MQRFLLILPLASALLAPVSPTARSIAVRPNSYLDDLPAAAATKPAPAPVAAPAPDPTPAQAPAPAPAPAPPAPVAPPHTTSSRATSSCLPRRLVLLPFGKARQARARARTGSVLQP